MNRNTGNRNVLPTKPPPKGKALPIAGSERTYTDLTYGTRAGVNNNNCFAYAFDRFREVGNLKLQPGDIAGVGGDIDLSTCKSVMDRSMADMRKIDGGYLEKPERACKPGFHKVMAFLAKDNDYHWYRQHKSALVRLSEELRTVAAMARALGVNPKQIYSPTSKPKAGDTVLVKNAGLWSHKQGLATGPLLKDACGKAIRDPRKACRRYSDTLDYTQYCGSICVKDVTRQTRDRSANRRTKNIT